MHVVSVREGRHAFSWSGQEGLPGGGEILSLREGEFLSMQRAH